MPHSDSLRAAPDFGVALYRGSLPQRSISLAAGLIHAAPDAAEIYDFSHALVQALYEELSPSRRARLHRRIAEVLETIGPMSGDSSHAEVAAQYHASRGRPAVDRGIPHALRAAEQARAAYAPQQAVALLRMARDLVNSCDPRQLAEVLERLAIAEAEAMLLEDVTRTTRAALDALLADSAGPARVVEFLERVARVLKEGGAPHAVWEPLVELGLALLGRCTRSLVGAHGALAGPLRGTLARRDPC